MYKRNLHRAATGALLLAGLIACGPADRGATSGSGVLVVAIDGLRADHLSALGYDRPTTPALDALAGEGVLFEQAFAAAPWDLPSHAALLTGVDPNVARRIPPHLEASVEHRWHVPADAPMLAVEMLVAGYSTAAFLDDPLLGERFGFAPGFQHFQEALPEGERAAAQQVDRLRSWLRSVGGGQDWFAYLHLADLERVWTEPDPAWDRRFAPRPELSSVPPVSNDDQAFFAVPRKRWRGEVLSLGEYEARYDGGLAKLDADLGRLFQLLREDGRWEGTTVVVVGTHGVQFGEAGLILDHGTLHPTDLHVPWILRPASQRLGGALPPRQRITSLASLIDVMPTLLELEGLGRPELVMGVSQLGVVTGDVPRAREFAFASCGLQQGYAAYGEGLSSILVIPALGPSELLRESWYGDVEPHETDVVEWIWDRGRNHYPPKRPTTLTFGREALVAAAAKWRADVDRTSEALRSAAWEQQQRGLSELFKPFVSFGSGEEER